MMQTRTYTTDELLALKVEDIADMPTLCVAQFDDLKIYFSEGGMATRVWLSRMCAEDGLDESDIISIERYVPRLGWMDFPAV